MFENSTLLEIKYLYQWDDYDFFQCEAVIIKCHHKENYKADVQLFNNDYYGICILLKKKTQVKEIIHWLGICDIKGWLWG